METIQKGTCGLVMLQSGITPENLELLLRHVDRKLERERVPIHLRLTVALGEVSRNLGNIDLPVVGSNATLFPRFPNTWISIALHQWYRTRYGDRLKLDLPFGRVAVLLRGDMWTLRIPVAFGMIEIFSARERIQRQRGTRGPARCNVIDCVEGLPDGVRLSLSENELGYLFERFRLGFFAYRDFCHLGDEQLLSAAHTDHQAAVRHLTVQNPDHGQSKWASLQATEKTLKAFIAGKGHKYSMSHELEVSAKEAEAIGLPPVDRTLLSRIQCVAGVRYGDVQVTQSEALDAHHAALSVAEHIAKVVSPP